MNGSAATTILLLLVAAIAAFVLLRLRGRPNAHHRRMIRAAERALDKLAPVAETKPGLVIAYVRKMHPHAVEELVLSAAERAGHKVRRNSSYVGDGGLDGMIEIAGRWHLVQTKRYSSAIRPEHVREFHALCDRRRMPGVFVHFGRTGPLSKEAKGVRVTIISGSRLARLVAGNPILG